MTTKASPTYWLAILPWLQLSTEIRVDSTRFIAINAKQPGEKIAKLGPISADCAKVLSSFRLSDQCGIKECTLLIPDNWDHYSPPDDDTRARFARTTNLLMLGAFAANRYGCLNPWHANAGMFHLQVATFTSPPGGVSLLGRGHDHMRMTIGAKWGNPLFYIPDQCNPPLPHSIDVALISSLSSLPEDHPMAQRLRLALPFFGWANSLANTSSWEMEVIALVAALEKLLEKSNELDVTKEIIRLLEPYRDIASVSNASLGCSRLIGRPLKSEKPVVKQWLCELYQIRNDQAHHKPKTNRLKWLPYEHLVMGAFMFPLLVKLLLAAEKDSKGKDRYQLTWDDKAACDAIDTLLVKDAWFEQDKSNDSEDCWHEAPTIWAATLEQAKRERWQREAIEIAKRISERK